jgi:hypothetical protein
LGSRVLSRAAALKAAIQNKASKLIIFVDLTVAAEKMLFLIKIIQLSGLPKLSPRSRDLGETTSTKSHYEAQKYG